MHVRSTLRLAALLLAVMVVLAGGLIVAVKSVNLDSVKELLATEVKSATGRTLTIGGPLGIRLGLIPHIVADNVTLSNPPGFGRADLARIKHIEMEIALLPLLKREILINRLIISGPDILIETGSREPGNLEIVAPNEKKEPAPSPAQGGTAYRFHLHDVTIENGVIAWHNRSSGTTEPVEIHKLTVRPYQTSAELFAVRLAATARGQAVDIDGTVGRLDAAIEGKPWPVRLQAGIEGMTITAEGAIAELFAFRGADLKITAQGGELYKVIQLAGIARPDAPPTLGPYKLSARLLDTASGSLALTEVDAEVGQRNTLLLNAKGMVKDVLGAMNADLALTVESDNVSGLSPLVGAFLPFKGPMQLSGQLRGGNKAWKLSGLKASLAGSDVGGDLAVDFTKRLHLVGKLLAKTLNLTHFTHSELPSGSTSASQPVKHAGGDGRYFSNQPLPFSFLKVMDVDLSLQAGKVVATEVQLTDMATELHLHEGRLLLKPFHAGLAGGMVEGEVQLDAVNKVPVANLHLIARQVELGKLTEHKIIRGGKSDLKVDLQGQGDSVRALMASATGETVLSVGEGKIENRAVNWAAGDLLFQVLGALNPLAKHEETTSMTCAAAHFTIRDGIATANKGIGVRTSQVDVVGSGTVDLRSETLDLGIHPRPRAGVGLSLSTPLTGLTRLRGTFAKPSIGIDNEGTLRTAATMGAAAATGGLSVLGELLVEKISTDSDPCRTALGQSPAQQKRQPPQKGPAQKQNSGSLLQEVFGR